MRERGVGRVLKAGWRRRGTVVLSCAAVLAVASQAGGPGAGVWARIVGELGIAPASAHRFNRRGNKGSDEAAKAAAAQSEQVRQAEAAQRQLQQAQQAEAALKRVQHIRDMMAAQQRRVQQLQQVEAAQRKAQQVQQIEAAQRRAQQMQANHQFRQHGNGPPPASTSTQVSAGARHQAVVQAAMARIRGRHQDSGHQAGIATVARHHQAVLQHVMAKLRGHGSHGQNFGAGRDAFGGHGHRSPLQTAMDRIRGRHQAYGYGDRSGHGQHGSLQHAIFSHIRAKLSGHKWRHGKKEETEQANTQTTPKPETRTAGGGLLQDAPDVVSSTSAMKLPDLISAVATKTASTSDSTMSRLGGPQDPNSSDKDSGKVKILKKDKDDDSADDAPKQPARVFGRGITIELRPPLESFVKNEVLAVNPSAAALARARELKFKILDTTPYSALGVSITRLEAPDFLGALIGRSKLQEEMPDSGFGLNRIYAAGRTVAPSGADQSVKSAAVPNTTSQSGSVVQRGKGCAPDRCFGISIINWHPQLAACAQGVKIGVIDTGIDTSHPAFAGMRFKHQDFIPSSSKKPSNQHGTGVFSLLAGDPNSSTPGLVHDATFFVGDAFFADRSGNAVSDTLTMLKALNWLKAMGVDVANLSFAGPPDQLVHDAIRDLAATGTVILAAAGNEGQDAPPSYPAAYKEVVAVTAVDRNLKIYTYANRGNHIDVAAPGVDVWTALPNKREGLQTGTSFAVPFVTSVIALTYPTAAQRTDGDPLAPKRRALALLQASIKPIGGHGRTPIFGAGLVQAPSHCDPRVPGAVASAGPKMNGWAGTVHTAQPTPPPQAGSWASTVHPVAGRK